MKKIFRTDIDNGFQRFREDLCHLMYPKLTLITQFKNKNIAPTYVEIVFLYPQFQYLLSITYSIRLPKERYSSPPMA